MKNLNNSLFKKFESNKINNLAKIVGGAPTNTKWSHEGQSGLDYAVPFTSPGGTPNPSDITKIYGPDSHLY